MRHFLDMSQLTTEDWDELKSMIVIENGNMQLAFHKYMKKYPNKIKVLGKIENDEIVRDEISMDGVKTLKGKEAMDSILKALEKKKNDSTDNTHS